MERPVDERVALVNAFAGDAVGAAGHLAAINGSLAAAAAARGDLAEAFLRLKLIARALGEAREIVALAGELAK